MHQGDLSEYLALGSAYQVYDPYSIRLENGRYVRTPISGNVIPKAQLDPVGMNFVNLYPNPNQAGTKDFRNNHYRSGKALEDYWVWIARVDHAFNENHRMFLRLHRDFWEEDKNRTYNNDVNGVILTRNNKGLAFDDVYVISPTFLMNFRYGLTFQDFPERRASQGYDLSGLGLSAQTIALSQNPSIATLPRITLSPFTDIAPWESQDGYTASTTNTFLANFTKMQGNHSIRFGPEFRIYRESRNRYGTALSPQSNYNATYTKANDTAPNPTFGGTLTSMLMGIPAGSMSVTDSYVEQDKYFALYIHDDWKVSRKLTLNLGLRWELETPITERFDRAAIGYAGTTPHPYDEAARANYAKNPIPELAVADFKAMGGMTFANVAPNGRTYWEGEKNNFQPRIGFAYQLLPKTILRGGYGVFTSSIGVNYSNTNQTGFSQSTPIQASLDNGLTFLATNANPFPTGLIAPPKSSGGILTNVGQGVTFFNEKRKHPFAQRWSFGIQQELPAKFMIEASYLGNRATRLLVDRELSFTPAEYLSTSPVRDQDTINFLGKNFPNLYKGLNPIYGPNMTRANLLRPYNQFSSVRIIGDPAGYSWYHSLQTRIERRLANSFTVQASYTWSKTMEAREFLNSQDPMPSEVVSSLDRTHRLTGSGIWELPFGRGRSFGTDWHKAVDFIAGGWQLVSCL